MYVPYQWGMCAALFDLSELGKSMCVKELLHRTNLRYTDRESAVFVVKLQSIEFCFGELLCEGCSRVNDQPYGCVNFLCSVQSCKLVQVVINLF